MCVCAARQFSIIIYSLAERNRIVSTWIVESVNKSNDKKYGTFIFKHLQEHTSESSNPHTGCKWTTPANGCVYSVHSSYI